MIPQSEKSCDCLVVQFRFYFRERIFGIVQLSFMQQEVYWYLILHVWGMMYPKPEFFIFCMNGKKDKNVSQAFWKRCSDIFQSESYVCWKVYNGFLLHSIVCSARKAVTSFLNAFFWLVQTDWIQTGPLLFLTCKNVKAFLLCMYRHHRKNMLSSSMAS